MISLEKTSLAARAAQYRAAVDMATRAYWAMSRRDGRRWAEAFDATDPRASKAVREAARNLHLAAMGNAAAVTLLPCAHGDGTFSAYPWHY